jgi:glutamine synthetase
VTESPPPAEPRLAMPERIRILFADQLSIARGKYAPLSEARKRHARFSVGTYAVTYDRALVAAPGGGLLEGLPDMDAVFDPDALRPGWEPNTRIAISDLELNGEPFALCGRSALKRAIAQWRALGYEPMVGIELEAYVFERNAEGRWVPYDTPGAAVYGTGPFADPAGLMDLIWAQAHACGFSIESMNAEFDTPQFELTLKFSDALAAADDIFLFRLMAREVLFRRGYLLCFMPKPIPGRGGSGLHVNLSLRDRAGANAFARNGALDLPALARGCVAGLLEHHEGMAALLAPTVNSYERLKPASLSGYWANWGLDHRSVSVRVSAEDGPAARIEHRVADGAASPYIAVATVLQAARLGVIDAPPLPPAEIADGLETVVAKRHIPDTLEAALDALVADTRLGAALGQPLVDNYVAIKRAEAAALAGKSPAEVFDYYAPFI